MDIIKALKREERNSGSNGRGAATALGEGTSLKLSARTDETAEATTDAKIPFHQETKRVGFRRRPSATVGGNTTIGK